MPVNKNEIRKDVLAKAMQCKTADELMELAKAEGFAITKDEAEAYFAELSDIELRVAAVCVGKISNLNWISMI